MTKMTDVWGKSLYRLASEEGVSVPMFEDVEMVVKLFGEYPDYVKILDEPSISKDERVKIIDDAFAGKIQGYLLNFLKILCENNAVSEFKACAAYFRKEYYADNKIAEAVVTSAKPLDENQKSALKAKLESLSGKSVIIKEKVDEKLIAGMKVELDGKLYDGTVSERLKEIRKKVKEQCN